MKTDTASAPELAEWLAEAALVVYEPGPGIPTPLAALTALPARTREKLRLVHYPDEPAPTPAPRAATREPVAPGGRQA